MVYGKTSWIVHPGNWNSPPNGIPNFQDWHLHVVTKLAGYPMKRAWHQIQYRVQQTLSGCWFAMCCLTSFGLVELLGLMFLVVSVHQIGHEDNKLCCKCCQKHCSRGARDLRAGYFSLRLTTFASCVLVGHVSFHMIDTVPNLPWKQAGINFVWKHCMYLKLGRENKARFKVGQNPTQRLQPPNFSSEILSKIWVNSCISE